MIASLTLPFHFDPDLLRRDLAVAAASGWRPHYNEGEYGGIWKGIALRSAAEGIDIVAGGSQFNDTELLARCPYFREVLAAFQCPLKSVRLLSLEPDSFIREHSDYALGYEDGEIRLHIPIETNPDVEFYLAGERLRLEEGQCYFVNVNLPHRVNNRGDRDRIHLVIDAEVNGWVDALFRRGVEEGWTVARSPHPPRNVNEFREFVLGNEKIRAELRQIENRQLFLRRCVELGGEHGFTFHDGDLDAAWRSESPLLARAGLPNEAGWTPIRFKLNESGASAEWIYTGSNKFSEPLFEDSVRVALRRPFTRMFRVEAILPDRPGADPAGFIFHVSRCGSTLVCQMFAAAGFGVISEAPPIDEILQSDAPPEQRIEWLRRLLHAMPGAPAIVKLDAWDNRHHALIRAAFPRTPWIFLHRDPVEVLVSQIAKPGRLSIAVPREESCARALEEIYRSGREAAADSNCIAVDYRELPGAVFEKIARHFLLFPDGVAIARMRDAAGFDAKNPGIAFQSDSLRKRETASPLIRRLGESLRMSAGLVY
jgi:hypothetical protein